MTSKSYCHSSPKSYSSRPFDNRSCSPIVSPISICSTKASCFESVPSSYQVHIQVFPIAAEWRVATDRCSKLLHGRRIAPISDLDGCLPSKGGLISLLNERISVAIPWHLPGRIEVYARQINRESAYLRLYLGFRKSWVKSLHCSFGSFAHAASQCYCCDQQVSSTGDLVIRTKRYAFDEMLPQGSETSS
jgi:hypothetical protein